MAEFVWCLTLITWAVMCCEAKFSGETNSVERVGLHLPRTQLMHQSLGKDNGTRCNFPPSVWCSSRKIAKLCQVESQCEEHVWIPTLKNTSSPRVHLGLYQESLCPDCKEFMVNTLWPAWKKLHTIIHLEIVPYGNAEETFDGKKWKFTCQHGEDECIGNLIETCAIHILKKATVFFPFIYCIEKSKELPAKSAPICAKRQKINYKAIDACVNSPLGNKLEHEMAVKTDNLKPAHTFVPWITLNGEHTDEIQDAAMTNLVKLICDTYKGPKPDACKRQWNVHRKDSL